MHIHIVAVGKLKEKYLTMGMEEYLKRLGPYAKVSVTEVPDEKAPETMSEAEEERVRLKEGERILDKIRPDSHVVALALDGADWTSERLSAHLGDLMVHGQRHVTFVIGGSLGLSRDVLQRADLRLSFGRMTFPHQLMRLILIEQIYRAFKIMRREPYHK